MRSLSTFTVLVLAASQLGATDCNGDIIIDPGFDVWCGGALCNWKVVRGGVGQAATWHAGDIGVDLLDADTAIEQFTPVDDHDGTCIKFELVSDIEETSQVELGIDIYGDGSLDRVFPVPTTHWKPVSYVFAVKPPYSGIRFELAKHGPGRAVVGRIHASVIKDGCDGVPEVSGGKRPLGSACTEAAQCASELCARLDSFGRRACAACDPALASCGTGQVCGFTDPGPPTRNVPVACVAAGARVLGEACLDDPECATGICTGPEVRLDGFGGVCSTCREGAACGTVGCLAAYDHGPYLCDAGLGHAARGAPCASDGDCTSGRCTGAPRRQCLDGRSCGSDVNCPVVSGLDPGPCTTVGVQGGSCD